MSTQLKSGIRTSEFALVVIIAVLTQINVLQVGGDRMKGIITGALAVAYALSRGLAKLYPPKDEPATTGIPALDDTGTVEPAADHTNLNG